MALRRKLIVPHSYGSCFGLESRLKRDNYLIRNGFQQSDKRKKDQLRQGNGAELLEEIITYSDGKCNPIRIFSARELEKATNNYANDHLLRQELSYIFYKGTLEGRAITVSKVRGSPEPVEPITRYHEVAMLSQINHANVVRLLGCCLETQFPILVYEFFSNEDLCHCIGKGRISWESRLKIATETAYALAYLHIGGSRPIIHRSIETRNIMLGEGCTVKIIGFERSVTLPLGEAQIEGVVMGRIGYVDPVHLQSGQLSEKSDVYSYGAVLFEILTGKRPYSAGNPMPNMVEQFLQMSDEQERLAFFIDSGFLKGAKKEQLIACLRLTVKCFAETWEERPEMKQVVQELWRIKGL